MYLKWASHFWLSIQNVIFLQRNIFWFWVGGWVGGWVGLTDLPSPPHIPALGPLPPVLSKPVDELPSASGPRMYAPIDPPPAVG